MATPITKIPKPGAEQYQDTRKLFLVPMYMLAPDAPEDGQKLLDRYWTEVRDHIENLERTLGKVSHVYHEAVFVDGDAGMDMIESLNPKVVSFIRAMCHSDARLEATDHQGFLEESTDWQRCISIGLMSTKVMDTAVQRFREATDGRYAHIGNRIGATLQKGEAGVLFIRPDHRVQFHDDVKVFYVSPPAQDVFKRWMDDQMRAATQRYQEKIQASQDAENEAGSGMRADEGGEDEDRPTQSK